MIARNGRGIVLALDVEGEENAMNICSKVYKYVDGIKIGLPLILSAGSSIVSKISEMGHVICDLKLADIPYINEKVARALFSMGALGIIIHGFPGRESVKAVVKVAREFHGSVFVVTYMSHPGAEEIYDLCWEKILEIGKECGVDGIVAPATRPEILEKCREKFKDAIILSPGIGAQGGDVKDAILKGANYLIVGRSIYGAKNPIKAARDLKRKIIEVSRPRAIAFNIAFRNSCGGIAPTKDDFPSFITIFGTA